MYSSLTVAVCAAATVLTLGGAGTASAAGSCPTAAPPNGATPDWILNGTTGSVTVTGSTDTAAPRVTVTAPFSVSQTQVHTLRAGDGPVVSSTANVSVCYMGVNGRDGSVFDSSYERAPRSTSRSPESCPASRRRSRDKSRVHGRRRDGARRRVPARPAECGHPARRLAGLRHQNSQRLGLIPAVPSPPNGHDIPSGTTDFGRTGLPVP